MKDIFIETKEFILENINQDDFGELKSILQDRDVMYAWEYAFDDKYWNYKKYKR